MGNHSTKQTDATKQTTSASVTYQKDNIPQQKAEVKKEVKRKYSGNLELLSNDFKYAGEPFTDIEFPPDQKSLNADNNPEYAGYTWKRIPELI